MTLDAAANVFVTGGSWGAGTVFDYLTLMYDTDGNLIWERRYDGISSEYDYALAIAVDALDNVYVTGGSDGPASPFRDDITTLKYDAAGTLQWARRYEEPISGDNALGYDVEVAADGKVYVAGFSDSNLTDLTVLVYDAGGDLVSERRFTKDTYTDDRAYSLALDDAGFIYVTGVVSFLAPPDYLTVKFKPCACPFQSDVDEDGFPTGVELAAMVDVLYAGKPNLRDQGCPLPRLDFNCDGFTTSVDHAALIDFLYAGGPPPCDPCEL